MMVGNWMILMDFENIILMYFYIFLVVYGINLLLDNRYLLIKSVFFYVLIF